MSSCDSSNAFTTLILSSEIVIPTSINRSAVLCSLSSSHFGAIPSVWQVALHYRFLACLSHIRWYCVSVVWVLAFHSHECTPHYTHTRSNNFRLASITYPSNFHLQKLLQWNKAGHRSYEDLSFNPVPYQFPFCMFYIRPPLLFHSIRIFVLGFSSKFMADRLDIFKYAPEGFGFL